MSRHMSLHNRNWRPIHDKIVLLTYEGQSVKDISDGVGLIGSTVKTIQDHPFFAKKLEEFKEHVSKHMANNIVVEATMSQGRQYLQANQMKALKKLVALVDSDNEQVALKATTDILDRTGLKPIEVVENRSTREYSPEEVEQAKKTITELQTIITRLDNNGSRFMLAHRSVVTRGPSSVTDKGSDAPTDEKSAAPSP